MTAAAPITPDQVDLADRLATKYGRPGLPGCEPDDVRQVALLAIHGGDNAKWRITDHLREHGAFGRSDRADHVRPDRGSLAVSTDAPFSESDGRTVLDVLPGDEQQHAEPEPTPTIVALGTNRHGTLYRCPTTGGEARTLLPFGLVRRAADAYTSPPWPSTKSVAGPLGVSPGRLERVLRGLRLIRSKRASAVLREQRRRGEPLDPTADPVLEAVRLGEHTDEKVQVGAECGRAPRRHYWNARRSARRRQRAFTPSGNLRRLSTRDRAIVRAAASGVRRAEIAESHGITYARVSQIVAPFETGVHAPAPAPTPDQRARAERNGAIARRAEAGETHVSIARGFGLTPQHVGQIVKAHSTPDP